ncbi:hypothetical protein ACXYMT_14005 [Salinimicrobium sp. CAU 1759]
MKKIKFLLFGLPMLTFLTSCEPEEIPTEASAQEVTPTEIYADSGEEGTPIDDKKD